MLQNLSQKPSSSAQDFCSRYLIENINSEFAEMWRANVSSFARGLMTVHRTNQTHGPEADALLADQMAAPDLGNQIHEQHPRLSSANAR
jgi:homogentisate 1,2-dioxygenase